MKGKNKHKNRPRKKWAHRIQINRGEAPGTVRALTDAPRPVITVIAYGTERLEELQVPDPAAAKAMVGKFPVVWINVDGLGDKDVIEAFGREFELHRLALEGVTDLHQRAKVDVYANGLHIVARMTYRTEGIQSEQLSMFLGSGFLITFQERVGDCLEPVRNRLREGRGRIRTVSADYLAYCVLDAVVDEYYPILEFLGETAESLEEVLLSDPGQDSVVAIRDMKRELLELRRAIWPLREVVNTLSRDEFGLITADTRVYIRDCYSHCIQVIDVIETYREMVAGLMDIYMSSVSNRMNEIMKVLTIFAAIFIPLTFVAGLYGMNFNPEASPWNMPELNARYGYPGALLIMALLGLGMLLVFRRKGWVGGRR